MIKRVCVYCASSDKVDQAFFDATEQVATQLAEAQVEVLFGGGSSGLMGKLADVMLAKGGRIIGIMPHFMREVEWAHKYVQEFHFTETMRERKAKLMEGVDGIITLAGGCGTLEEVLEAITLKRLGLFTKPIVILNTNQYYEPLKQMFDKCIEERFMAESHRDIWQFVDKPQEVLPTLQRESGKWSSDAIQQARV